MKWAQSLIRLSNHQVDELQRRLNEIVGRRQEFELRLAMLHAEAETEKLEAVKTAEAGWYHIGFIQGWRQRRDRIASELAQIAMEEAGARDALSAAYAELKKFEQVAETARAAGAREAERKDAAEMDELGRRNKAS